MTAQQQLFEKYGEPNAAYIDKYCHVWKVKNDFPWFPASRFLVNDDFKDKLHTAFKNLEAKGLHTEIKTFDGCYNDRQVRGSQSTSLHAWATAIDLNASENGMVNNPTEEERKGKWSEEFIQTMKNAGVFFGGDFIRRADPMHWALFNG